MTTLSAGVTAYEDTDSSISYTGAWYSHADQVNMSSGTFHQAVGAAVYADIAFSGTNVTVLADSWYNHGRFYCTLVDMPDFGWVWFNQSVGNTQTPILFNQTLCSATNIPTGDHTLRMGMVEGDTTILDLDWYIVDTLTPAGDVPKWTSNFASIVPPAAFADTILTSSTTISSPTSARPSLPTTTSNTSSTTSTTSTASTTSVLPLTSTTPGIVGLSNSSSSSGHAAAIGAGVGIGIFFLIAVVGAFIYWLWSKKQHSAPVEPLSTTLKLPANKEGYGSMIGYGGSASSDTRVSVPLSEASMPTSVPYETSRAETSHDPMSPTPYILVPYTATNGIVTARNDLADPNVFTPRY